MIDILMRNLKDKLLSPFLSLVSTYRFSPNIITYVSGVFGLLSFWMCWEGLSNLALLFWILNRVIDGLDGAYA